MPLPDIPPAGSCRYHSKAVPHYNCLAWAVGDSLHRYWPFEASDPQGVGFDWPAGLPSGETVDAVDAFFRHFGFTPCADATQETGFERVALYVDPNDNSVPSHAAWQLEDGRWASKIGRAGIDCLHLTPEAIHSRGTGVVKRFYRRPRQRFGIPDPPFEDRLHA